LPPSALALSYFAHLVATVIWIGGLATLLLLVWPAARRLLGDHPQGGAFLRALRKRFVPWTNFALVVLLITGFIQMSGDENYEGLLQFENDWSRAMLLKHIAFIGMIIFGVLLQYGVAPAIERAQLLAERGKGDPAEAVRLAQRETTLSWVTLIFGVAVLAFTAWATAL
jgi:uncharacterized membrane protein